MSFDLDQAGDMVLEATPVTPEKPAALVIAEELETMKLAGTALVKDKKWAEALKQYKEVVAKYDGAKQKLFADLEAERMSERCMLACLSNMALCALNLKDYHEAKRVCGVALERHKDARVQDGSARAKLLYRRGQACLGLEDPRMAVESFAAAVEIEESVLGITNKDATMRSDNSARVKTIQAMKRELAKARKAAKDSDKAAVAKGHKGFLNVKSNRLVDPTVDRKEAVVKELDRLFETLWQQHDEKRDLKKTIAGVIDKTRAVRLEAEEQTDQVAHAQAAFAEGLAAFIAAETKSTDLDEKDIYEMATNALGAYWALKTGRDDLDVEPPRKLGDIVAHEATAHAFLRCGRYQVAKPHFLRYVELWEQHGELPAYHNLPDSFLLQRGMEKMDDGARRAFRWKHRAQTHRAYFDAVTSLCAIAREDDDRDLALENARKCLAIAKDNEEKLSAHKNLAFLYNATWHDGKFKPNSKDQTEARIHQSYVNEIQHAIDAEAEKKNDEKAPVVEEEDDVDDEEDPPDPEVMSIDPPSSEIHPDDLQP